MVEPVGPIWHGPGLVVWAFVASLRAIMKTGCDAVAGVGPGPRQIAPQVNHTLCGLYPGRIEELENGSGTQAMHIANQHSAAGTQVTAMAVLVGGRRARGLGGNLK